MLFLDGEHKHVKYKTKNKNVRHKIKDLIRSEIHTKKKEIKIKHSKISTIIM